MSPGISGRRLPRAAITRLPRNERVVTACGCVILPEVIAVLDPSMAECRRHGWQPVMRKAAFREVCEQVYGIQLTLDDPDVPPF